MTDQPQPPKPLSTPWLNAVPDLEIAPDDSPAPVVEPEAPSVAPAEAVAEGSSTAQPDGPDEGEEALELDDDVEMLDAMELEVVEPAGPPPMPPAPPPTPEGAAPPPPPPAEATAVAPAAGPPPAEPPPEPEPERSPIEEALEAARSLDPRQRLEGLLREMDEEDDKARKAVLCYEVGEVQEGPLGDEAAAIKSYSKALGLDSLFLPNLWAVRRIFWRRQLWPNLIKLLDAELKAVTEPTHRVSLLMEKGDVLRRHLGDPDRGLECFREAHAADPAHLAPILALEKIYRERGQLDALQVTLHAHVEATQQPERKAALLLSLAQLDVQLPDGSYERRRDLLREALTLSARPERVLEELERMATLEGRLEDVLEVLEFRKQALLGVAESSRDAGAAEKGPEEETAAAPEDGEAAAAKDAAEPSEGEQDATKDGEAVAAKDAGEPSEGEQDAAEADDAFGPTQSRTVPADLDGRRRLAAFAQARLQARLLEKAGQPEQAWERLRPWGEILDDHPVLQGDLRGLAARLGRWDDLAAGLEQQLAGTPAAARQGLELERALALHRAGRGEEAAQLLRGYLEATTPHPVVLAIQELTALGAGDTEAQLELLRRTQDALDALSQGDSPEALDAWHAELWTQRALLCLEAGEGLDRVKEACRAARAALPGYPPATDLLETLLLQEGAWSDLVALYKLELVGASEDRAIQILEALAEIQTVWHPDPDGRLDALLQLTVRLPESLAHRLRLLDAVVETGRPEDLLSQITSAMVYAANAPELAAELSLRGARVAMEQPEGAERAADFLRRGLDLCPGHAELTAQLEALLREAGQAEALVDFYRTEAARTLNDDQAGRLLLQLAWVLERDLARPKEAAEVYDQLWQRTPEDRGVLALLARSLSAAGEHERLAEIREIQAQSTADSHDQAVLYQLLGEHYEDRLQDELRAEEAYLRARAASPERVESLHALVSLAQGRRDWTKAAEVLDEMLRSDLPTEARRQVLSELAWLAEGPRADPSGASEHWMELATMDPPIPTAFWAAVRLAVGRREWGEAAGSLDWLAGMAEKGKEADLAAALTSRAGVYGIVAGVDPGPRFIKAAQSEAGGEAALVLATDLAPAEGHESAQRLQRRLKAVTPPEQRGAFDLVLAALLEREGRVREAGEVLRNGLQGAATDLPRLLLLRHFAGRAGDQALIAEVSERLAGWISDDEQAAALLREGAAAAAEPAVAARLLRQALTRSPGDGEALGALVSSLVTQERFEEAVQCLGFRLGQGVPDDEAVALRWQRAQLRLDALKDPASGAVDLYQVLQLDPDHGQAMVRLARLQAEDGAYDEAAALLEQRLDLNGGDEAERRAVRLLLAEVRERGGRPPEVVLEPLEALLLDAPEDPDLLERKHAVHLRARDFAAAVAVLDQRYRGLGDRKERAQGELRKAAIYRDLAANDDEARRAFEAVRDLDPLNRDAILGLSELYRKFGDQDSLMMVLSSAVDAYRESIRRQDVLEPDPLRFLARLFREAGNKDGHFFVLGALELLGDLDRGDTERLKKLRAALVDRQPGRLTAELWAKYLLHPFALGGITDLWELIGPATYRIWPEEPAAFGVGRGDRVAVKSASGVAREIFELASSLGIVLEELYVGGTRPTEIHGLGTSSGPTLVVGSQVGPRLSADERHRVGALLAGVRLGTLALPRIPTDELELLVAAAVREGQPDYRSDLSAERVEEVGKRLRKALSRKERKALPLTAVNVASAGVDLTRWRLGVARSLARVGLLCSGDLKASVEADGATPAEARVTKDDDAKRALVLFAVSEAHLELRLNLGVAR